MLTEQRFYRTFSEQVNNFLVSTEFRPEKSRKQHRRPHPVSSYTGQIGSYNCILTSSKSKHILWVKCKCFLQEVWNHIWEQSRGQNASEVNPSAFFSPWSPSLPVSQRIVHQASFLWPHSDTISIYSNSLDALRWLILAYVQDDKEVPFLIKFTWSTK